MVNSIYNYLTCRGNITNRTRRGIRPGDEVGSQVVQVAERLH